MKGEILYLYAYDVAYELPLERIEGAAGKSEAPALRPEKSAPREVRVERCLRMPLGPIRAGEISLEASADLYPFGVVSVTLRLQAVGAGLADFVRWHEPPLPGGRTLDSLAREGLDRVLVRIAAHVERGSLSPEEPEAYTVFRFPPEELGLADGEGWLEERRREVAGLLTAEGDGARLSEAEVSETLKHRFSYYRDDVVVLDWDAAFLVERGEAADVLRTIELANLQLVEYRYYDAVLDRVVERAYDDLERFRRRGLGFLGLGERLGELREMRVSLSEVAEEVSNATKFIGDWHLARLYMGCAERFHLPEWKASVEEKLRTLDELYNLAAGEATNRKLLALEVVIVLLFLVDLLLLAVLPFR